jgi:rRNA-processing protein EBP2
MTTQVNNRKGRLQSKDEKAPTKTNHVQMEAEGLEEEETEKSSAEDEEDDDEDEEGDDLEENETDEGVPFSDLESNADVENDVDIVPYIKLHKDNHAALTQALSTFALPLSTLAFHVHQSVTASESVTIDVNDDLTRELAFYKQALEAVKEGRKKLLAEGIPFSRPADYFAEMVKDDEHMEKVSLVLVWILTIRFVKRLLQRKHRRRPLNQPNGNAILRNSGNKSKFLNFKTVKKKRLQLLTRSKL